MVVSSESPRRWPPHGSVIGPAIVPVTGHRLGHALDGELGVRDEGVAVTPDVARLEAKLREALDVEEVGRLEVAVQVLVLDDDAGRLDDAFELRLLAAGESGLEVAELAAERGDDLGA